MILEREGERREREREGGGYGEAEGIGLCVGPVMNGKRGMGHRVSGWWVGLGWVGGWVMLECARGG